MKPNIICFFIFFSSFLYTHSYSQDSGRHNQIGMLILGSADEETTKKRVQVGYDLYKSVNDVDYIIVAGGCGAHGSRICEAELMEKLLREKGVPKELIFKEDKSRTSAQNYCYSKKLKRTDGTEIITQGDLLYIVSNHWHAISVAGCFTRQDGVNAQYHIEGSIEPNEADKTDYVNIFKNCTGNEFFCTALLWPLVDAGYYRPSKSGWEIHYFSGDVRFQEIQGVQKMEVSRISEAGPVLPSGWEKGIDAAFFDEKENKVYYIKGRQYLRFSPTSTSIDRKHPKKIEDLVGVLPANWEGGYIDAAFLDPEDRMLYLFKGSQYCKVSMRTSKVEPGYPKLIKDLVLPWPFQWANGNIDAALFDSNNKKVLLFRGKEVLFSTLEDTLHTDQGYPVTTPLNWPSKFSGLNPDFNEVFR